MHSQSNRWIKWHESNGTSRLKHSLSQGRLDGLQHINSSWRCREWFHWKRAFLCGKPILSIFRIVHRSPLMLIWCIGSRCSSKCASNSVLSSKIQIENKPYRGSPFRAYTFVLDFVIFNECLVGTYIRLVGDAVRLWQKPPFSAQRPTNDHLNPEGFHG